jgi:hypothetical protein
VLQNLYVVVFSKPCRRRWLAVVNALHGLDLASDQNVQDGIIRQESNHPSFTSRDLLIGANEW